MIETITKINSAINGFVWGLPMLILLVGTGILMTLLTKVLKASGREDHAFLVGLCGLMIVILWVLPYLVDFFATVEALMEL